LQTEYDLIIVGAGAAGCSAAVTARQRNMSTLLLFGGDGALGKARLVDNYPGLPDLQGPALLDALRNHAGRMGAELKRGLVRRVMPLEGGFSVLAGNDLYYGKTVLLAMGTARVRLLPGEEELVGQGVSYCATCDGMFYKGGRVLVVASDAEAVEEANYLATLARVVYVREKAHNVSMLDKSVEVAEGKPVSLRIQGEQIILETTAGEVSADGAFVIRPAVAMTQLIPEVRAENGALVLDEKLMTSVPGVFAAGDIAGSPLQVAKAVGEGNVAALSAAGYLMRKGAKKMESPA